MRAPKQLAALEPLSCLTATRNHTLLPRMLHNPRFVARTETGPEMRVKGLRCSVGV